MSELSYPEMPEKQYFTIGEAASLVRTRPHILRYWEKRAGELLNIVRRQGGRRCYSRKDILLLRRINTLCTEEGYTLAGVRAALLRGQSPRAGSTDVEALKKELKQIVALL